MYESAIPELSPWPGAEEADWREWESGRPAALLPTMANTAPSGIFALETDMATVDPAALADAELVDGIVGWERIAAWARARQYALLAEFARRPRDGTICATPVAAPHRREWAADEVAMALQLAPGTAGARIGDSTRFEAVLRPTLDLLAAGRLDHSRARLVATQLAVVDSAVAIAVQARVLPAAPGQTWGQLRASLRRAILAVDHDGAADRHRRAVRTRRVDLFPDDDGMATLWARLTAVDAASCFTWTTRLARGLQPVAPGPALDDDSGPAGDGSGVGVCGVPVHGRPPRRRAGRPAHRAPPDPRPRRRTDRSRLSGRRRPAARAGRRAARHGHRGGRRAGRAQRIRPRARPPRPGDRRRPPLHVAAALTDPESGVVLDHGRTTYRPPAGLADLVRARDGTCHHPACRRTAAACELDHVVAWRDGGPTGEANLVALCPRHHLLKEGPGWQVVLHADRTLEWVTPTGHRYRSRPADHRTGAAGPAGSARPGTTQGR